MTAGGSLGHGLPPSILDLPAAAAQPPLRLRLIVTASESVGLGVTVIRPPAGVIQRRPGPNPQSLRLGRRLRHCLGRSGCGSPWIDPTVPTVTPPLSTCRPLPESPIWKPCPLAPWTAFLGLGYPWYIQWDKFPLKERYAALQSLQFTDMVLDCLCRVSTEM